MARAPVYGSVRWPAWIDRVWKPNWRGPAGSLAFGQCWALVDWPAPAWPLGPCCSGMLSLPPARYERLYIEREFWLTIGWTHHRSVIDGLGQSRCVRRGAR